MSPSRGAHGDFPDISPRSVDLYEVQRRLELELLLFSFFFLLRVKMIMMRTKMATKSVNKFSACISTSQSPSAAFSMVNCVSKTTNLQTQHTTHKTC